MRDFKEARLIDITIGNGTYGIAAPAVPKDNNKYTYLRITDINDDGSLNFSDLKSVDDPKANKYLLKPNDIVFARTGNSTGRSYFYDGSAGELVYAGFLIKFSLDSHKVNPKILKYYTHSKNYYDWVASFDSGATRGNINAKTFAEMPITLPPRNIQDKIVAILSALDEKIETNRKINARLEELAQAIFKSWFIDFEPIGGKMPENWEIKDFDVVVEVIAGGTPKTERKEYWNGNIPWISVKDFVNEPHFVMVTERYISQEGLNNSSTHLLKPEDTIISARGTVGAIAQIQEPMAFNQSCFGLRSKLNNGAHWLYYLIHNKIFELKQKSHGSVFDTINRKTLSNLRVIVPAQDVLDKFHLTIAPIIGESLSLSKESARLAALRDNLLPKLMSGELIPE